ncbi:HDIG domain-containing metalloprotein [Peptacetobacter sp. AB845]|uniref:HDIG domain-containing metalloprotein n=1 Tax=Peptacetobacter sp. AB845 TaxID=3388429 RepID=UPI0039C99D9E
MLPKRVRQFIMNLTDRINEDDYKYVESKLNKKEYEIFNAISKSEQKHSVRVAKEIENIIDELKKGNNFEGGYTLTNGEILDKETIFSAKEDLIKNEEMLIKVGLLHDVGKSRQKINIIDKSIIVILNKLTSGKLRNINLKKIQCYYNHSEYSYEILKEINVNNVFLEVVRNHHNEYYSGKKHSNEEYSNENYLNKNYSNKNYSNKDCGNEEYYLGNIIKFFQGVDDGN